MDPKEDSQHGLLRRRKLRVDTLSPSISGHPVDPEDEREHPPELDRLSPSLERASSRFKHFDHQRGKESGTELRVEPKTGSGTQEQTAQVKGQQAESPRLHKTLTRTDSPSIKINNTDLGESFFSTRARTRAKRSFSDPDPVEYIPDIEVEKVDPTPSEDVFTCDEDTRDRSVLFKAASYVLHGSRGINQKKLRLRSSEPSCRAGLYKPKMFMTKKSKKLVIRLPNGDFVEGKLTHALR